MTSGTADLLGLIAGHFASAPPQKLGVAVSGGSDSTALLLLLRDWAREIEIQAVTVDHGLRPEAAQEADLVARLCAASGIGHDTLHWRGWDGHGNLMQAAREARYALIGDWARARGIADIALGHTEDDLAETFLMRIERGAGLDGLAAMSTRIERGRVTFHRPLLRASRDALRGWLGARGIGWCEDPTNRDPTYDRARIRAVMAALHLDAGGLARTARRLREARDALAVITADWAARHAHVDADDIVIGRDVLLSQPDEIIRRFLAGALRAVGDGGRAPRGEALARLIDAVRAGRDTDLQGARVLTRKGDLRILRDFAALAGQSVPSGALWDGRWRASGPEDAKDTGCRIAALGEAALGLCPDRKATGRPAASLIASPAVWRGGQLVAAPLAGLVNGWSFQLVSSPAERLHRALLH